MARHWLFPCLVPLSLTTQPQPAITRMKKKREREGERDKEREGHSLKEKKNLVFYPRYGSYQFRNFKRLYILVYYHATY